MTTPQLDADGINSIINSIVSIMQGLGTLDSVNQHEPKQAPNTGITGSVWVQSIKPVADGSGLSATSGVLLLAARVYMSFISQPFDMIDPIVTSAANDIMAAMTNSFTFGAADVSVRCLDLLGMYGTAMSAAAGYVEIDRKMFRVMTVNIPVIVNDLWAQTP
jgi:hypothetical protein